MVSKTFRVAIMGDTPRGGYGHWLDLAFVGVDGAEIVALSDPDEEGRQAAIQRTGAPRGYADYREMLEKERPDIAVVASRNPGDHLEFVLAAADAGASVYMSKPCAASPAEVDQMMAACEKAGTLLITEHPWRGSPSIQKVLIPLIKEGKIGKPCIARAFGYLPPKISKIYGGNGDELFLDFHPHMFDLLWQLFGAPLWCHAHITQDGRSVTPADVRQGTESYGLVAGNELNAYYAFESGIAAQFEFYEGNGDQIVIRIDIQGTEGTISIPGVGRLGPDFYFNPASHVGPFDDDGWEAIPPRETPDLIDAADLNQRDNSKWINSHHRMARSMMDMLEGKTPEYELVQGPNARLYLEMAMAAHASHIAGARVSLPLPDGKNPFDSWTS